MSTTYVLRSNLLRFLVRGFRGYAWSCLKNLVKVAIGRKPYFTSLDNFFRLYLRQRLGCSAAYITCDLGEFRDEGAGSQALMMMRALHFARTLNLAYVHTPFVEIYLADR